MRSPWQLASTLRFVLINQDTQHTGTGVWLSGFVESSSGDTQSNTVSASPLVASRMAMDDDVLPGGVMVPAGAKIYLCQYVVHRNSLYFPDPDQFDPGRFSPESIEQRPHFAYFPFGGGPRTCIGEVLARLEGVIILAMLAGRFQFELVSGRKVVPYPGITLRPRSGIQVKLKSR